MNIVQEEESRTLISPDLSYSLRYPNGTDLNLPVNETEVTAIVSANDEIFTSELPPNFDRNFEVSH